MSKKYYYNYDKFEYDLTQFFQGRGPNIFKDIDLIVALARGGLVFAQYLGYLYNIREIISVPVAGYRSNTDTGIRDTKYTRELSSIVRDKKILLVDDIYDSGKSIELVKYMFKDVAEDIKTFTMLAPNNKTDYKLREAPGMWVVFPWDAFEEMGQEVGNGQNG